MSSIPNASAERAAALERELRAARAELAAVTDRIEQDTAEVIAAGDQVGAAIRLELMREHFPGFVSAPRRTPRRTPRARPRRSRGAAPRVRGSRRSRRSAPRAVGSSADPEPARCRTCGGVPMPLWRLCRPCWTTKYDVRSGRTAARRTHPLRLRAPDMSGAIPQRIALKLQLAAISGNEPTSSFLELRVFRPDMTPATDLRTFVGVRDLDRAAARVLELAPTHHVYVSCARRAWVLWADCDGPESVERLRAFRPRPSIVTRTSADHMHAFWQLSQSVLGENVRRSNRRLAFALGADRNACDAARVLRPVGGLNHKHTPPAVVTCVRLEPDAFTVRDIVGSLPDDPSEVPQPRREFSPSSDGPTSVDGLVRSVAEAPEGARNNVLNWAAYKAAKDAAQGRVDLLDAAARLRDAALIAGLDEREAETTLWSGLRAGERSA
jgi:hypothetical protein